MSAGTGACSGGEHATSLPVTRGMCPEANVATWPQANMFTMWAHCSWAKGGRRSFAADAARTSSAPQSPSRQSTATTRGMEAVMSCIMNDETGAAGSGVLAHLASCAAAKAKHLTPEETRDIALCFAHLGYVNMAFKAAITDAVVNKIDQFEPGVLADTAWAFGKVKYYDAELLQHLLGYLKSNPERFDASGYVKVRAQTSHLCKAPSSCCIVRMVHTTLLIRGCLLQCYTSCSCILGVMDPGLHLPSQTSCSWVHSSSPFTLFEVLFFHMLCAMCCQILWALRRFGLSGEKAMDVICEVVQKLAAKHATKCIAEVAYAEGRLRWADPCVQGSVVEYVMNNIKVSGECSALSIVCSAGGSAGDSAGDSVNEGDSCIYVCCCCT